jgi:hypothetical protein
MGAISHHHFEGNPFQMTNKSSLQSGGAESWSIVSLNLNSDRAVQFATQTFNVSSRKDRAVIRSQH